MIQRKKGTLLQSTQVGTICVFLLMLLVSCGEEDSSPPAGGTREKAPPVEVKYPEPLVEGAVASSDLGAVTRSDLDDYILSLPEEGRRPREGQDPVAWRSGLVEQILADQALEQRTRDRGIGDSEEAQRRVRNAVEPILVEIVKNRRLAATVSVTEEDLRTFYDQNPDEFGHDEQIRLRHIFRRLDREAPAAVRKEAETEMLGLLARLRNGANFGELARAHSDSETAPLDGLIGRFDKGVLDPALEEIIWKLEEGEISDVVVTPVGMHIYYLETRIAPFRTSFEEARKRLRRRLEEEASKESLAAYESDLIAASGATYDPGAFDRSDPEALLFELGEDRITVADWERRVVTRPFEERREEGMRESLAEYVQARLFLWEAERSSLREEPEVAASLASAERQTLLRMGYEEMMRERAEEISEEDLISYYEEHQQRFQTPRLHHLRILTQDFPDGEVTYEVYETMSELALIIESGARSFDDIAREYSDDISRKEGGDVGFVRLDLFGEWAGPRAQEAVSQLSVGQLSDPMLVERYDRTLLKYRRQGYMLIRMEAIQEPEIEAFEVVRDQVKASIAERDAFQNKKAVIQDLMGSIHAVIHEENL